MKKQNGLIGKLDWAMPKKGFLKIEDIEYELREDKLIKARVLNGDIIKVLEDWTIYLVEREQTQYSGKIVTENNGKFFIRTNTKKIWTDFMLEKTEDTADLKVGDQVIVEIVEWTGKCPVVKLIEFLGAEDDWNATVNSILIEFGFPHKFPEKVEQEAEEISGELDLTFREDIRDVCTITIDPISAKDFDDALSIRSSDIEGYYEIGVHIADVSHYVKPDSELDREAYKRANSVYLLDRVVPMLPEKLSNNLCSLVPNQDRYALSIFFTIDLDAKIKDWRWSKTVINSNKRFSYEEAFDVLQNGGEFYDELTIFNNIAKKLHQNRLDKGAVILESAEVRPILVNNRIEFVKKERTDSHKLIEEWMLLANVYAAKTVKSLGQGVYRYHPEPDEERLEKLSRMAKAIGHEIDLSQINVGINSILTIEDKDLRDIMMNLAQRSMSKAVYDSLETSHFGLAFDEYCHETSPIRRYSDVLVHRIISAMIEGDKLYLENLQAKCNHISSRERISADAERAVLKQRQITELKNRIGCEYNAIVTGFSERGIWVELEDIYCEGMISSKLLPGYEISDHDTCFKHHKGDKIKFGQTLRVKIIDLNIEKRQLNLDIVKDESNSSWF